MTAGHVNLVKLCVGADSVEDLADWQVSARAKGPDGLPRHVTRMWPKRAEALCCGGSLYWVIRGAILCRQRILRLDEVTDAEGTRRCGIVLDPEIRRTVAAPRRPFQGWRYLSAEDAPLDLRRQRADETPLPAPLQAALAEIGVF